MLGKEGIKKPQIAAQWLLLMVGNEPQASVSRNNALLKITFCLQLTPMAPLFKKCVYKFGKHICVWVCVQTYNLKAIFFTIITYLVYF